MRIWGALLLTFAFFGPVDAIAVIRARQCPALLLESVNERKIDLDVIEQDDPSLDQFAAFFTEDPKLTRAELSEALERRDEDFAKITRVLPKSRPRVSTKLKNAVQYYSIYYDEINRPLREGAVPEGEALQAYESLSSADFGKLHRVVGTVFRSTRLPEAALRRLERTRQFEDPAYMSASIQPRSAQAYDTSGGVFMVIRSKSARYIAPLSELPMEEEVLFPAGTRFRVDQVFRRQRGFGTTIVFMTEA